MSAAFGLVEPSVKRAASGVGVSSLRDPEAAGVEAARKATAELGGSADVVLVFATAAYEHEALLTGIRTVVGDVILAGCSAEGVVHRGGSDERERSVAVLAMRSELLRFESFFVPDYDKDSAAVGAELARRVREGGVSDLVGLVVLPDGLSGDCTAFLNALSENLGNAAVVVGGAASDALTFSATAQFEGWNVATRGVAALAIRGRGRIVTAVSHGCSSVGLERTITDGHGSWVRAIDGKPAWDVFREYLGADAVDLSAEGLVHVCIGHKATADGSYVARAPLKLDAETGALMFPGGGFETGMRVRLLRRDPDLVRDSARKCAEGVAQNAGGAVPLVVFQFDCAGRGGALFGSRASEEIVFPLQEALGHPPSWIGFYTYGELAPLEGRARYHNYTVALAALYEES